MGGFMLYDGERAVRTILPANKSQRDLLRGADDELGFCLKEGHILISEKRIEDKSKGDPLAKGFVIIQTSWFVLQSIARAVQHLPLTELELVTLAFASLNLVVYVLWWKKPLNVGCPVPVYIGSTSYVWPEAVGITVRRPNRDFRNRTDIGDFFSLPFGLWRVDEKDEYDRINMRVHTFYSCESYLEARDWWALVAVGAFTAVFGAIHVIAWSAQFPTHKEQMLWRISSTLITGLPAYMSLFMALAISPVVEDGREILRCVFCSIICLPCVGLLVVPFYLVYQLLLIVAPISYVVARIILLIQPLVLLRSLAPGADRAVQWSNFIPHM
jgi:hypothetical protein